MFSFIQAIIAKVVSIGASVIIAVGLVSVPSIPVELVVEPQIEEASIVNDTISITDELRIELDILKKELQEEKDRRIATETSSQQNVTIEETIEESDVEELLTFTLSNGVVVDELGNIISMPSGMNEPETVAPSPQTLSTEQISELVSGAVVLVETPTGHGSGFVIENGKYILTNAHVVKGIITVDITQDQNSFRGTVIGRDEEIDVALISTGGKSLYDVSLGNSNESSLGIGSELLAFGFPLVYTDTVTITRGILSARNTDGFLQTDASIHAGNSGGPLVDNTGKVVGINTSGVISETTNEGYNIGGTGLGFAIPINIVIEILPSLKMGRNITVYKVNSLPQTGSTIDIPRSIISSIGINPNISCSILFNINNEQVLCQWYKNYTDSYTWNILEDQ